MSDFTAEPALEARELRAELLQHGIAAAADLLEFDHYPANFSRRAGERRWHSRVRIGERVLFHLIFGENLRRTHEAAVAMSAACAGLTCPPRFFWVRDDRLEFLGLGHFEGPSLDALVQNGKIDSGEWLAVVRKIQAVLANTSKISTSSARAGELQTLVDLVSANSELTAVDRALVRELIQPVILRGAEAEPPTMRWSNGDFVGHNILLDARGEFRLIDYESGALTHFWSDDWNRLLRFSCVPADVAAPEFDAAQAPWREAYCWLRQLSQLPKVESSAELAQHLPEVASRLLGAAAGDEHDPTGSRLLRLAARHRQAAEKTLARQRAQTGAVETQAENLSRHLFREQRRAAHENSTTAATLGRIEAELVESRKQLALQRELLAAQSARSEHELAYYRQSLSLQRTTLRNVLKNLRHAVNLLGDWLLGPLLARPCPHRLRHAVWHLDQPRGTPVARTGLDVTIRGKFRDADGRPASEIFALVGKRRISGIHPLPEPGGENSFAIVFRTKPGLKWVRVHAQLVNGITVTLGYRLVFCQGGLTPPPTIRPQPLSAAPSIVQTQSTANPLPLAPHPRDIALPECSQPVVSIIVPVYNQTNYALRCLAAIARHTRDLSYEVILLDDCSPEPDVTRLHEVRNLRLHRNPANRGFLSSCKAGATLARGGFLVFLNSDTEVEPGWLPALLEVFHAHPDAGLVGAKLIYPDRSLQEAGGICWQDGSAWNYGRNQNPDLPEFRFLRETDYCSAACIALPRDLWSQLDGFDERYSPAYYEDTDLAFRVRAAGRKVFFQPKAVVIHHEGKSHGVDLSAGVKANQVRNQEIFFKRWATELATHASNGQRVFRARERSLHRKVILVIDHFVPSPDQDAGSRNLLAYLRFFLGAGFSVKFIGEGGASRPSYVEALEEMGVEVPFGVSAAPDGEAWLTAHGHEIDYVFLSRAYTTLAWLPRLRHRTSAKLLFYGHDLLSRTFRRAYGSLGDPQFLTQSCVYDEIERQIFAEVDWIFYPSSEEVAFLKTQFPLKQTAALPLLAFGPPQRRIPAFADRSGILFVGGFGHPPNVDAVQWFVSHIWPELIRLEPDLRLTIAGAKPTEEIRKIAGGSIRLVADATDAALADLYRSHRVAIAPLRYGGGVKGKILEAMFLGTPVITTAIGAEGLSWEKPHLVIADDRNFVARLRTLYRNEEHWSHIQEHGWQFVASHYSEANLREALLPAIPELQKRGTSPAAH